MSHKPDTSAIHAFDVTGSNTLTNQRVFCDLGSAIPDGFRVDTDGNVGATQVGRVNANGVQVFAPNGDKIGAIHTPEVCPTCVLAAPNATVFL